MGDVVHDAYGEVIHGLRLFEVLEHSHDVHRSIVLGGESVAAADDQRPYVLLVESAYYVEVERLAGCAGFLGAVEHRDALYGLGQRRYEMLRAERPVEAYLYHTDLLAAGGPVIEGFLCDFAAGTHADDDVLGFGIAVVVKQMIIGACDRVELVHVLLDYCGQSVVELIGSFPELEEDVGVYCVAAELRVVRVDGIVPECGNGVPVEH